MRTAPAEHDLVLLGGGHSHLAVLRRLAMRPLAGVRTWLIARELHTPYSGMLPGLVAGHYRFDAAHVDLGPLAAAAGARLVHETVRGLELESGRITFADRPALRFDTLSINTGATPSVAGIDGRVDRLRLVKPISSFLPALDDALDRVRAAEQTLDMALVGGGAGGVELVLALANRLRRDGVRERVRLHLVTAAERVVAEQGAAVARRLERELSAAGIDLWRDSRVVTITDDSLVCASGSRIPATEVVWATAAGAPDWAAASGLALDDSGFVAVGPTLQSRSHGHVFAAGDVAALTHAPRPKAGVYAVRAGPVLAHNLSAWIRGRRLRRYRPQRRALQLISTGDQRAVVVRTGLPVLTGSWVWRWKDRIDRRFMHRYQSLQPMPVVEPQSVVAPARGGQRLATGMRCRGCGGKVAAGPLAEALAGFGDGAPRFEDAAALRLPGLLLQQTMDGFALPVADPYLGGRLAAIHALGDLHAMGADPVSALALAGVPYGGRQQMRQDLTWMMAGAERELRAAGCELLGGHSCEAEAPTLGLALTGRIPGDDDAAVLGKDRLRPGQCLVLTKPLGSGVLLAGAAAGKVASRHLTAAVDEMLRSNGPAMALLRHHGASACTDVTGFGLLGHALEMAQASGCGIELNPERVPAMAGALEALRTGISSSLQDANEDALLAAELRGGLRPDAEGVRLLCDPQTCGGLLASMPEETATACVVALQAAGFTRAAIVGRVAAGRDHALPIMLGARHG